MLSSKAAASGLGRPIARRGGIDLGKAQIAWRGGNGAGTERTDAPLLRDSVVRGVVPVSPAWIVATAVAPPAASAAIGAISEAHWLWASLGVPGPLLSFLVLSLAAAAPGAGAGLAQGLAVRLPGGDLARWTAASAAAGALAVAIGSTLLFAVAFSNGPAARTPASVLERDGRAFALTGGIAGTVYAFVTTLGLGARRRLRHPAPSAPADDDAP